MKLEDLEFNEPPLGRAGFTFQYESATLKAACDKEAGYHRDREAYYDQQASELETQLREKGVELREQQVTGGAQFSAVVDPQLGQMLTVARSKRDTHRQSAELFEAYAGAFGASNTVHWLTIDDVRYFGIYIER